MMMASLSSAMALDLPACTHTWPAWLHGRDSSLRLSSTYPQKKKSGFNRPCFKEIMQDQSCKIKKANWSKSTDLQSSFTANLGIPKETLKDKEYSTGPKTIQELKEAIRKEISHSSIGNPCYRWNDHHPVSSTRAYLAVSPNRLGRVSIRWPESLWFRLLMTCPSEGPSALSHWSHSHSHSVPLAITQ